MALERRLPDISGVAARGASFLATDGYGGLSGDGEKLRMAAGLAWDNHLIAIARV